MFSFVVTEEQLAKFKDRAREAIEEGIIEPRILPACQALLDAPGIAPMWSCEGHDNLLRDVIIDGKPTTKVVKRHPHIVIAVTADGLRYISAIGDCLAQQPKDFIWQIEACRLADPTRDDKTNLDLYWAWGIHSVNYRHRDGGTMEERGQRLNDAILEAVKIVRSKN